jgi:hypothetical protein
VAVVGLGAFVVAMGTSMRDCWRAGGFFALRSFVSCVLVASMGVSQSRGSARRVVCGVGSISSKARV